MVTVVRPAQSHDLEGILRLYRELRPHDPVLDPSAGSAAFERLLKHADIALMVCDCDGTLSATCMLAVVPNMASGARPFGVIEHVVTLQQFRRRGHARLVLRNALELAWSKSCYKVVLLSGARRTEAHKLYESVGFVGDVEKGFVARSPGAV